MWSAWLFYLLVVPGASQINHARPALMCVSDYMTDISCEWEVAARPAGQTCKLWGSRGSMNQSCVFNTTRSCWLSFSTESFSFYERIHLEVNCNNTRVTRLSGFRPAYHVKLRPPEQLSFTDGNLTWNRGTRFPNRISKYEFQLQVKSMKQRWEAVKPRVHGGTWVQLDRDFVCDPLHVDGAECEARVRVKPIDSNNTGHIHGQWSDWSSSVTWKTDRKPVPPIDGQDVIFTPVKIFLMGFGAVVLLLMLISTCICKDNCALKTRKVPDPSKYFRPLIVEHKGNFQQWLGRQHSTMVFLPTQSCDCEISPVDEIYEACHDGYTPDASGDLGTGGYSSHFSSGISNMGYFYSEHQPGSVSLDTCPVYFSYHPEVGLVRSTSPEKDLPGPEPTSPDSGFGTSAEKDDADEDDPEYEGEAGEELKEGCSRVNVPHLVSFVLSVPDRSRVATPPCFSELSAWPEEAEEASEVGSIGEPAGVAVARPSSMVVQPCSDGYLTLKEMQKYSNKSI